MTTKYTINTASLTGGTHEFKIKARTATADYSSSDFSNIVSYTKILPYLETPTGLSVINKTVSWNPVTEASGYMVEVNGISYYTAYTGMTFPDWLEGSTYSVRVQALGDDINYDSSEYTDIVSYTVPITLAVPTGLNISNKTLHWTEVSGAVKYIVAVKLPSSSTFTDFNDPTDNSCSLSNLTTAGIYNFKIMAVGNGDTTNNSDYSSEIAYTLIIQLTAPTELGVEDGYLYWNSVSNASSYYVYITAQDGTNTDSIVVSGTSYSLSNLVPGTYCAEVFAMGDNTYYLDSSITSYFFTVYDTIQLAVPTGLYTLGNVLHWTGVNDAIRYTVAVKLPSSSTFTDFADTTTTSCSLSGLTVPGTYYLSVMAVGNGTTIISSAYSDSISYIMKVKLLAPANLTVDSSNILQWEAVDNAVSYHVTIKTQGGSYITSTTVSDISYSLSNLPSGIYYAEVYAIGDGTYYLNSSSNGYNFTVNNAVYLDVPTGLSASGDYLYWDSVANASGYCFYITTVNGTYVDSGVTYGTGYSLSGLPSDTYYAEVYAMGDDTYYLDSGIAFCSFSVTNTVQLASPTGLSISGGYLYWNSVANASSYYVIIGSDGYQTGGTSISLPTTPGTYSIAVMAVGDGFNYTDSDYAGHDDYVVDEPVINLNSPDIIVHEIIQEYATGPWHCLFAFSNPNPLTATIEYDYAWDYEPFSYNGSWTVSGNSETSPITGLTNTYYSTRTFYITARIEYQGNYSASSTVSVDIPGLE